MIRLFAIANAQARCFLWERRNGTPSLHVFLHSSKCVIRDLSCSNLSLENPTGCATSFTGLLPESVFGKRSRSLARVALGVISSNLSKHTLRLFMRHSPRSRYDSSECNALSQVFRLKQEVTNAWRQTWLEMCYGVSYLLALLHTTTIGLLMHQREYGAFHVFGRERTSVLAS